MEVALELEERVVPTTSNQKSDVAQPRFNSKLHYHTISPTKSHVSKFRLASLLISDLCAATTSWCCSWLIWIYFSKYSSTPFSQDLFISTFLIPTICLYILSIRLNHYTHMRSRWIEFSEIIRVIFYSFAFSFGYLVILKADISRLWLISSMGFMCILIPLFRFVMKDILKRYGHWSTPLLIIGSGKNASRCQEYIETESDLGYEVVARIESNKDNSNQSDFGKLNKDELEIYNTILSINSCTAIFAPDNTEDLNRHLRLIDALSLSKSRCMVAPPVHGLAYKSSEIFVNSNQTAFIRLPDEARLSIKIYRSLKQGADITLAILLLILLSPLLLAIFIIVRSDGGPGIYKHKRIGYGGREFSCLKFRTMHKDSDNMLQDYLAKYPEAIREWTRFRKLQNDPRVTFIGKILRRASLDELPQLINVIRGEMSLVGPRPIVHEEIPLYGTKYFYYTRLRPGITGLWQVSGRNTTSFETRVQYDVQYFREWSLWNDIVIIIRTAHTILVGKGAF